MKLYNKLKTKMKKNKIILIFYTIPKVYIKIFTKYVYKAHNAIKDEGFIFSSLNYKTGNPIELN